jgi:hypothetical protein
LSSLFAYLVLSIRCYEVLAVSSPVVWEKCATWYFNSFAFTFVLQEWLWCETRGSHSSVDEDSSLRGCYSLSVGTLLLTFWSSLYVQGKAIPWIWRHYTSPAPPYLLPVSTA